MPELLIAIPEHVMANYFMLVSIKYTIFFGCILYIYRTSLVQVVVTDW
jgi:hypothetical protein